MQQTILRTPTVQERLGGITRSTLWRWVKAGRFPKPVQLGPQAVGWLEHEIDAWLEARAAERDAA